MWVYYLVLIGFFLLVGIKVADATASALRVHKNTVRKQGFLDSFIEAIFDK